MPDQTNTAEAVERLRAECAGSNFHDHDGCSCSDAELLTRDSRRVRAAETPAPIATPEEVALRIVEANSDGDSFTDNKAWLNKDGMVLAIAAALTSSNAEIERLKERLRSAEATVDTFMRAQEHYREAMDERNTFKNAARAAEAQAEASSLTARRDGERDGLLKAADLIDARERDAHAEAALRAQDGDRAGDMHWCAKSLALNQAAKTLRALASTVPGGEEPS
jgi:hypothetical protein